MPSRGQSNMGRIEEETPAGAAAGASRRLREGNGRGSRPVSMQLESPSSGSGAGGEGKAETAGSGGGQRLGNDVMPDLLPAGAQSSQGGVNASGESNASASSQEKVRRCFALTNQKNDYDITTHKNLS